MAQPVPAPTPSATFGGPVTVVGPEFVSPYPIDLDVVRKMITWLDASFVVTDSNGTIMFKVKGHIFILDGHRALLDASDKTVVSLYQVSPSPISYDMWCVLRGESTDAKDTLITVKRPRALHLKNKLYVFLGPNPNEEVWDYRIEGSWSERSCVIYAGNTNNVVAQTHKKESVESASIGKVIDHFGVTVSPNIDYAFIVSLIVILDATNRELSDPMGRLCYC